MTFHLLHAGAHGLLASGTPVIKAADVEQVASAADLLVRAERILADAEADSAGLRAQGRSEGLAEGVAAVRAEVASALAAMARDLAAASARRDEELAEAALAAVKAMLGEAGPDIVGPALVRHAIASFADGGPVQVTVASALAERLQDELKGDPRIELIADAEAAPLDCEIRLPSGTIRAGLDVQLQALAERWGLPAA